MACLLISFIIQTRVIKSTILDVIQCTTDGGDRLNRLSALNFGENQTIGDQQRHSA